MSVGYIDAVFKFSRSRLASRLVLLALADAANDDGVCWLSVKGVARKARVSESVVHKALRELTRDGELEMQVGAGPRGCNLYRVITLGGQQLALGEVVEAPGGGARSAPPSGSAPVHVLLPEPSVPSLVQSKEVPDGSGARSTRGADFAPLREVPSAPPKLSPAREAKRVVEQAVELWQSERRRRLGSSARFLDAQAMKTFRLVLGRVVLTEQWGDIAKAIYDHAGEQFTEAPWKIDDWTVTVRVQREEAEYAQRQREEREHFDRLTTKRREADNAAVKARHPGLSFRQIVYLHEEQGDCCAGLSRSPTRSGS